MTAPTLSELTAAALAARGASPLVVGFSGGPDSTALLHVLASLSVARDAGLTAIHVDHGLNPASAAWATHCRAICAALHVPLTVTTVRVDTTTGSGIEAAARDARYAAFAAALPAGATLVLAQHRDDQVETVLLKLLRGAGPDGLGGMREVRPFAAGTLWRPWLAVPRAVIAAYVAAHHLDVIADPANVDPRFARNRLRHAILPALRATWPQADASILHSAAACRATADRISADGRAALAALTDGAQLDAARWIALDAALRVATLEQWLHSLGLPAPTTAQRRQLEQQSHATADGSVPEVRWARVVLHLWRGRWHVHAPLPSPPPGWRRSWTGLAPLDLPLGRLLPPRDATPATWEVRLPIRGQRLLPAGSTQHHPLSELFRTHAVPPWLRPLWPLVFAADGELLVVPGLRLTAVGAARFGTLAAAPTWQHD